MAVVDRTIIDKNVHVGARARVGVGQDMHVPNEIEPRLNTGITLIGKNAVIPPSINIGRNCVVASDTQASAFQNHSVESGQTIGDRPITP
jgi:glucose-1-phosphate adenylyltransferase